MQSTNITLAGALAELASLRYTIENRPRHAKPVIIRVVGCGCNELDEAHKVITADIVVEAATLEEAAQCALAIRRDQQAKCTCPTCGHTALRWSAARGKRAKSLAEPQHDLECTACSGIFRYNGPGAVITPW